MIKPEQIPDAAAFVLDDARKDPDASPWDLIAAAINAWPMKQHRAWDDVLGLGAIIILPLTENTNAHE